MYICNFFLQDSQFFQIYDLDLERGGILGDGSFSVCRRCIERSTGKAYAVKIVSRQVDCTQEINLLRACKDHPNIVKLHNVYYDEVIIVLVLIYTVIIHFVLLLALYEVVLKLNLSNL